MTDDKKSFAAKFYNHVIRQTLAPVLIITCSLNFSVVISYVVVFKNSNLSKSFVHPDNVLSISKEAWRAVKWTDAECWTAIAAVLGWGILSLLLPGKKYFGPSCPNGFRPQYWHSGFKFYLVSAMLAVPLIWYFPMLHWYYQIPNICAILAVLGTLLCVALYLKGLFKPCPGVHSVTGNPIFDFYWGIELYPHIGFVSLKMLINSRFGLFLWQLIVWLSWKANYELQNSIYRRGEINYPITASTILQTIFLAKFYWWEDGYMQSLDIILDRFGFYIAWGCIAFVPSFYTLSSLYLVKHSPIDHFGFYSFALVMGLGLLMICLNYWTDYQRQVVRETNGKCNIWGKPAKVVRAEYVDENGHTKRNVLLASGFWAISRHLNYTYELLSAFLWSVPALFASPIPYFYFIFLTILLIHRSVRDEEKCSKKYGNFWTEYKKLVPYKMLPGIY